MSRATTTRDCSIGVFPKASTENMLGTHDDPGVINVLLVHDHYHWHTKVPSIHPCTSWSIHCSSAFFLIRNFFYWKRDTCWKKWNEKWMQDLKQIYFSLPTYMTVSSMFMEWMTTWVQCDLFLIQNVYIGAMLLFQEFLDILAVLPSRAANKSCGFILVHYDYYYTLSWWLTNENHNKGKHGMLLSKPHQRAVSSSAQLDLERTEKEKKNEIWASTLTFDIIMVQSQKIQMFPISQRGSSATWLLFMNKSQAQECRHHCRF